MSNTLKHAEIELDILVKSSTDPDNRPIIEPFIPELLALVDKFAKSGQSGGSAPYTATALSQALKSLCLQEPICQLTGLPEEWADVSDIGGNDDVHQWFQNKRCGAIFKDGKNGEPYYLDAIAWKTQTDSTWSGNAILPNGEKINSRQFLKGFPFTPKTFIIDVIEKEVAPDDWEFYIKDESQLEEVFQYYSKPKQ